MEEIKITNHKEKPHVGSFTCFRTLGETVPGVKTAKKYLEMGGKLTFFSHGGEFEHLGEETGGKIVKLLPISYEEAVEKNNKRKIKYTFEKMAFECYNKKVIEDFVEEEIEEIKKHDIDLIVATFNPTVSISARVLNIPVIVLTSGTYGPIYFDSGYVTYPESYENSITRFVPSYIKNNIVSWLLKHNKMLVRDTNKVARKYKVKPFKNLNEIVLGDYTLLCDDINFIGLKPTKKYPKENFIGPIFGTDIHKDQNEEIPADIKAHLEKPGRSILVSMGTTVKHDLLLNIINTLNQTNYNIIVTCGRFDKSKWPEVNDNILLKVLIRQPLKINKMVDLAVIHGGRGTVYTSAYSGKPSVGIPMFVEQQYNLDTLVRNGVSIRGSRKFFKPEDFLKAIETIFNNYGTYYKNAQDLSAKLTREPGEVKAASRIIDIYNSLKQKN